MLLSVRKRRKDTDEIIGDNEYNNKDENKINSNRLTRTKRIIASCFGVASGIMAGVFGISGTHPHYLQYFIV
ncbi:hypothetical protein [Methanobacterium sp. SMA-27]|uniref:hypothetical protein n=1 Tax=Methanobacterium sp. SMA-27 TaxID=1495336 RepID=UPI001E29F139|nr:hypothetical protein [Methanobacterium sp. SMA-27]